MLDVIATEIDGLIALEEALSYEANAFDDAIQTLMTASCVIVTGMGKSGFVAQKVAATMTSTGTQAQYLHPADASHGDLGVITTGDTVLAFSWSGETTELEAIVSYTRRFKVPLIAITSSPSSALGTAADIVLVLPKAREACPFDIVPTTSIIMMLALGDCLAIEMLTKRGFTIENFGNLHPGGKLGAKLKRVSELMHSGAAMPLVYIDTSVAEALFMMTRKAMGCVGVMSDDALIGIVTDGDLRRHINNQSLMRLTVEKIMTSGPLTISPETLAATALEIMNANEVTSLFVVTGGLPVGIVHIHDLLRAGAI